MIQVKVRLYATLRRHLPGLAVGQPVTIPLTPRATVSDALDHLGIPRAETKICFVNGVQRDFDHRLGEDDELGVFPPVAGG